MKQNEKISINRTNPRNCTGPKTPEGKAGSFMNAVTHGLRAHTIALPTENREDSEQIHDSLQEQYGPQNPPSNSSSDAAPHCRAGTGGLVYTKPQPAQINP
jgi:hypothetical protein